MIIINKPEELMEVQCYLCKTIMKVHPMSNMNADWVRNCELHKPKCNHPDKAKQYAFGYGWEKRMCKHCNSMQWQENTVIGTSCLPPKECHHKSDGLCYTSCPPQNKCIKCGGVLQMISNHPTLPDKYLINFDLRYRFEDDYQIHIERSCAENPNRHIDLAALNHIAASIELMLAKLRFEISLKTLHDHPYRRIKGQ